MSYLAESSHVRRPKLVELLGYPIDALTMAGTLEVVDQMIASRVPHQHVVVNAAKLVNMRRNPALRDDVINADLVNADGMAVVWAARVLGVPVPERVAGVDLMDALVERAAAKGWRPFFLGAREEVVGKVVEIYQQRYPGLRVAGHRNGYFSAEEEPAVVAEIAASQADLLFVAMSSPKKERFLSRWKAHLAAPFQMGVGGSFDVVSGRTKRAPVWMQKVGLEWFFRFLQEPRRLGPRYVQTNLAFVLLVLREKLRPSR